MADKYTNKVIYDGTTLIDLTGDTVEADKLLSGYTTHDRSGAPITGTCTFDSDTSADTAASSEILNGKTAHVLGALVTGSMANNGSIAETITTKAQAVTVPVGYHDGSGTVSIDATEQNKIIADNIKAGVSILGTVGTYTGSERVTLQAKSATPTSSQQVITADEGYTGLSQVTVAKVPYTEGENAAGGITVTIL